MISVVEFHGDPWTVPQPKMRSNTSAVKLEIRYVWYALLHIDEYPVFANDIEQVIIDSGYNVNVSQIGHIMRKLCNRGYFTRTVYHRGSAGPYYKYVPTNVFRMVQDHWRRGE